jgi:phage terminase small subunit
LKTKEAVERSREELQNPDMAKLDRAMRALLKVSSDLGQNGPSKRSKKTAVIHKS